MKCKKLIPLIMIIACISCTNKTDKKSTIDNDSATVQAKKIDPIKDSNVYEDIDLFKLEGIREIKYPTSYPYIKIENQSNLRKRIVYKHSAIDSTERIYEKKVAYWYGYSESRLDTGYCRLYEYIESAKITQLNYYGSWEKTGFHLDDITIIERNKTTMYSYWSKIGPYIEPAINNLNLNLIKDKVNVIVTENFTQKNGILTTYSKSIDKIKNQVFKSDTSCYNIGEHSWFWFEKFGWSKKVDCN